MSATVAGCLAALCAMQIAHGVTGPARNYLRLQPDLLLVVVDALRADRLSLYGYHRPTTPQLDRRRQTLRWFTDATAQSTQTAPSVASLFTGVPPRLHNIQYDTIGQYFPPYGLMPKLDTARPTLAESLRQAGYDTRALVASPWLSADGFNRGFQQFDGWKKWDRAGRNDDEALMEAVRTLVEKSSPDRPRFLYAHLMTTHNPYEKGWHQFVREAGVDRYVNGPAEISARDLNFMSDLYDSDVAFTDMLLGRLLDRLVDRKRARPIVVCITSDHGDEFLEHGGLGHGTTLYHELARVPVIFWGPEVITRTGASTYPLELGEVRDLFLTLGGAAKGPLAGLVSADQREPAPPLHRQRSIELNNEKAIYEEPWKYIVMKVPFKERLFNLEEDGRELVDRAAKPGVPIGRLREVARRWWRDIPYPAPPRR